MNNELTSTQGNNEPPLPQGLIAQLRELIRDARSNALRAVDAIQVRTCWEIGRHIVEFEQGGAVRAEYGAGSTNGICAICGRFFRSFQFGTQCVPN